MANDHGGRRTAYEDLVFCQERVKSVSDHFRRFIAVDLDLEAITKDNSLKKAMDGAYTKFAIWTVNSTPASRVLVGHYEESADTVNTATPQQIGIGCSSIQADLTAQARGLFEDLRGSLLALEAIVNKWTSSSSPPADVGTIYVRRTEWLEVTSFSLLNRAEPRVVTSAHSSSNRFLDAGYLFVGYGGLEPPRLYAEYMSEQAANDEVLMIDETVSNLLQLSALMKRRSSETQEGSESAAENLELLE